MPAILRLQRLMAGAALAGAMLIALGTASQGVAPLRGELLNATAADLRGITGFPVEVQASRRMRIDLSLPLICKRVVEAFREAAEEPETKEQLGQIVRKVVIEDWSPAEKANFHAVVYKEVLTIQAQTGQTDVEPLRPLIVGVLKKAARVAAGRGH